MTSLKKDLANSVYDKCRSEKIFLKSESEIQKFINNKSKNEFYCSEVKKRIFRSGAIGYTVSIEGKENLFFPDFDSLKAIKLANDKAKITDSDLELLGKYELVIPPYIPRVWTLGFINFLKELPEEGDALVEQFLRWYFTVQTVSDLYVGLYRKLDAVPEPFENLRPPGALNVSEKIFEALECFYMGRVGAATLRLLPCVETLFRELGRVLGIPEGSKRSLEYFKEILEHYRINISRKEIGVAYCPKVHRDEFTKSLDLAIDERIAIADSLEKLIVNSLYREIGESSNISFNRHKIIHGWTCARSDQNENNFYKLLLIINLFGPLFLLSGKSEISCFHPDTVPESRKIAEYFSLCSNTKVELAKRKKKIFSRKSALKRLVFLLKFI